MTAASSKPRAQLNDDKKRLINALLTIGRRVEAARKQRELTQSALADLCGLSQHLIRQIERAQYKLNLDTLLKLAEGLNCSVEALVREV